MMTDDIPQNRDDRLALLLRLTKAFNSSLDLDEVLTRVMDEVIAALHAERGFIVLVEAGDTRFASDYHPADDARSASNQYPSDQKLTFRAARGLDHQTIQSPEFKVSRGTIERVVREGAPILTSDAQLDGRLRSFESVNLLNLRSVLCVPLKTSGPPVLSGALQNREKVIGAIYVDHRLLTAIFTEDDLELLTAIASSAAIAIENARLHQVAVEKARMERELQIARTLQESLMPETLPQIPGWELAARWQPAHEVAGDFYDYLPLPDGRLGVIIADVCDKGMASALIMAISRSILRASLGISASLAEDIRRANRSLCADARLNYFVTVFCGILDPASGELTYVNAGHNPPLFCPGAASTEYPLGRLAATGMALGIDSETPYRQARVQFEPGGLLLMYTDGVTEAANPLGELLGMERLQSLIQEHVHMGAAEFLKTIQEAVQVYGETALLADDLTLLFVRRL